MVIVDVVVVVDVVIVVVVVVIDHVTVVAGHGYVPVRVDVGIIGRHLIRSLIVMGILIEMIRHLAWHLHLHLHLLHGHLLLLLRMLLFRPKLSSQKNCMLLVYR